jgi:lysozyme
MRRILLLASLLAGCGGTPSTAELDEANTQQCPSQVVEGLDVYAGDGTVDWTKVKGAGREFAFIKATQGNYNRQSTFAADWSGAAAAGVLRSAYHFFDATIDGTAQAQWFLSEIAAAGGMTAKDLPPMLDIECPTSSVQASAQANCEYAGNSGWAPPATVAQRAFDWLATVEQATGRKPIIYSYPAWFADAGFTDAKLAGYPLFIATYGPCASVPAPWTSAVFWQYSATGSVPGVTAAADEDRFFGALDALMGFGAGPTDGGADLAVDGGRSGDAGSDGGQAGKSHGGCSCRFAGGDAPAWPAPLVALALAFRRRRLTRQRRRTPTDMLSGWV